MKIAPGVRANDWRQIDFGSPRGWRAAIAMFERRIRGRFTDAIDLLIADDEPQIPTERRWGFSILALDCLLIETLEAFRRGLTDTRRESKKLSVAFLTQRKAFSGFFTEALATRFYYEFRCGVAHNAQVFGTGRVWSVGPLLTVDDGRITVNRTAFHHALLSELQDYVDILYSGAEPGLRENFRKKMDFIAEGKFQ